MKISTQEGYGLRILLSLARNQAVSNNGGMSISEISRIEDMSQHNVAKTLRILRLKGFVNSERGHSGGYMLSKDSQEIMVADILSEMGGKLFDESEEIKSEVLGKLCTDSNDCSLRSLWTVIQYSVDNILQDVSLHDLMGSGNQFRELIKNKLPLPEKRIELELN